MSVFDVPRLHFGGTATSRLPTGPKSGLVDLATNTALTADGRCFPSQRPPADYHDYLDRVGSRYDSAGRPAPAGPFNAARGSDFSGNGHFAVDARIVGVEQRAGDVDTTDPIVGRGVDMWGHYNEYLATTANRARVFDVDPASDWTTTLMVGQFAFGRDGRSHDVGYMASGEVAGFQPPRWHNVDAVRGYGDHWLAARLGRSVVHQFTVTEENGLTWIDEVAASPAVEQLRALVGSADVGGLVVQFALHRMSPPLEPDRPSRWGLRGTIAPWRREELRTYPAGRLLVPGRRDTDRTIAGLHNTTIELTDEHVTLNMITAVPETIESGVTTPIDLGDLELRTVLGDEIVAHVPRQSYLGKPRETSGGLVTVPRLASTDRAAREALVLVSVGADGRTVQLREREVNVQVDDASLILEHPRDANDDEHDVEVCVRSFIRGVPAPLRDITARQFFNPRALPCDPAARSGEARCSDVDIVRLRAGRRDHSGAWTSTVVLHTDHGGYGWLTLRGATAGTARVLLSTGSDDLPCDPDIPGSATTAYDHADALGYWSGAGHMSVRVLPDDWWLADIDQDEVTFDLVYTRIFAYYEQLYSFMSTDVFSLADRCKVETYAKLIWQMCDPRNKDRTYYMPPTRELSEPKARLLLTYLRAQQKPDGVLLTTPRTEPREGPITNRDELVRTLREAAKIELAVMLQYLYAAYSVPTHGAGIEYVRRGVWTSEQLRIACGDGGETLDEGVRSMLLTIAREEMIHFLLVNNILIALGEPFHVPEIDFARMNHELPVPLDFCLERLGIAGVERFALIEQPEGLVPDLLRDQAATTHRADGTQYRYASLSELYADIRKGLKQIPDLFVVDSGRGGGEHHLFLRQSLNQSHPDYQLEVDDLSSALFAVDVITEQGEGGTLDQQGLEDSHYASFLRIGELLRGAPTTADHSDLPERPWSPAYPVARNPSLSTQDRNADPVTDPSARAVMDLFNRAYFLTLQLMAQHFGERPDASLRRSDLMNGAIDMMTGVMRPLAELLVTMPSGRRGTTAGPSFELPEQPRHIPRVDVARRRIAQRLDLLATDCAKNPLVPTRAGEMSAFWADHFRPSLD